MSEYEIDDGTVWVLAEKGLEVGDKREWKLWEGARLNLEQEHVPGLGDALLVFSGPEWAEKYIRDSGRRDLEPKELPDFLQAIASFRNALPTLTCFIVDRIYGHIDVQCAVIDDFLRGSLG